MPTKNQNKTTASDDSVQAFLDTVDDKRKADCQALVAMMTAATGQPAKMWGKAIVGFGSYHYKYDSGREGDFMRVGFSPRKTALTLYIMSGFDAYETLLAKLGKHKVGKSCLYVKKLADVDQGVLRQLVDASLVWMEDKYPTA